MVLGKVRKEKSPDEQVGEGKEGTQSRMKMK